MRVKFQDVTYDVCFTAAETDGDAVVEAATSALIVATRDTKLLVKGQDSAPAPVDQSAYEALGGLDRQIKTMRTLVELPLTRPELFRQYGTCVREAL